MLTGNLLRHRTFPLRQHLARRPWKPRPIWSRRGADLSLVAFRLFDERSFVSTQLLGIALSKMQSASEGQLVWTALSMQDFLSVGTGDESVENVVNFLRNVKGARLAMIFRERRDETGLAARVSVRSVPELRADLFAGEFGGGGHAVAAGFRVRGNFDQSRQRSAAARPGMARRITSASRRLTHNARPICFQRRTASPQFSPAKK